MNIRRAAVSFTGGKDCTLCLHRALKDEAISVVLLVTFAPVNSKPFLAHPMHLIEAQSEALGIPHKVILIEAPFLNSYQQRIKELWDEYLIELLFTGDILDVCNNFMFHATEGSGVELVRPLWGISRNELMQELINEGFDIVVSCVNIDKMGQSVANDSVAKSYFYVYEKIKELTGIDRAGEAGEFHTMVLNPPRFNKRIEFKGNVQTDDTGHYLYFNFNHVQLVDK
ncbi:unnamed protein product [Adineta steineri]|uniref:Diphthine--ammonia ligase n=1 Tax=Adineta steineri TaxID=433720 RepID=A0A820B4J8_9BILA|nr:unnamed protein product [Adineta steineri]CAF4196857.1 unnamed protein product [Adineta steineri]